MCKVLEHECGAYGSVRTSLGLCCKALEHGCGAYGEGWQRAEQTRRASQTSQTSRAYERAEPPLSQRTSKVIPARLGERRAEIALAQLGSFGSFVVAREILISPNFMNNSE